MPIKLSTTVQKIVSTR